MNMEGFVIVTATVVVFSVIGILYAKGKKFSVEDYITARGSLTTWKVAATLFASSMGAWILFSPAESTIRGGINALIGYALGSAAALFIFMWIGDRLRSIMPSGHSITEFVLHRFGRPMYILVLLLATFYMGIYLAAELTAIGLATNIAFSIPTVFAIIAVGLGTISYTVIGGMKVSAFTDRMQAKVIIPLITIVFFASLFLLGGFSSIQEKAGPQLFDLSNTNGMKDGITLIIAIVGANIFHQGYWQRAYAAKDQKTARNAFLISGLLVIPVIMMAGFFGFFSIASGASGNESVALFNFLLKAAPKWVLAAAIILSISLVMSTIDTLLNGLVSLFTVDFVRLKPKASQKSVLVAAKCITLVIGAVAMLIATKGYSVLYLFLVADLACTAAAFPVLYGLYSKKFSQSSAVICSIAGMIAGAFFFPNPAFTKGSLFLSFLIALAIPAALSLMMGQSGKDFDFKKLKKVAVFKKG